jgi:glycosyltransferase involved in cell wall biosynthesis
LKSEGVVNEVFTLSYDKADNADDKQYTVKILHKKFNLFDRLFFFGKQFIIIKEISKSFLINEICVVHAHTLFSSGFAAYILNKKYGLPYIVAVRSTDLNLFLRYMLHLRIIGFGIIRNAQSVIFLSPAYQKYFIETHVKRSDRQRILERSVVIPNGIDDFFLENIFEFRKTDVSKTIKLIFIGEISDTKNILATLRACNILNYKGFVVRFTVVGDIVEKKYRKIISGNSYIVHYKRCPKEEVLMHLRNSEIFVMPSFYETFGIAYAEALSQGLPLIYSKGQGFDGHFEDGFVGFAVKPTDYAGIAQKIIHIHQNYKAFSERCISVVRKFDWKIIASNYNRLYRE